MQMFFQHANDDDDTWKILDQTPGFMLNLLFHTNPCNLCHASCPGPKPHWTELPPEQVHYQ